MTTDAVATEEGQGSRVLRSTTHNGKPEHSATSGGFTSVGATVNKRRQTLVGKGSAERDGILSHTGSDLRAVSDKAIRITAPCRR